MRETHLTELCHWQREPLFISGSQNKPTTPVSLGWEERETCCSLFFVFPTKQSEEIIDAGVYLYEVGVPVTRP